MIVNKIYRLIGLHIIIVVSVFTLEGQNIIYNDTQSKITGTWVGNGAWSLSQIQSSGPFEGTNHYRFNYSNANGWAGLGLDIANWSTNGHNFAGYTHLSIAYKGMSGTQQLSIKLRTSGGNPEYCNEIYFGNPSSTYKVIEIPILSLINGTNYNINNVTALDISVTTGGLFSGTLYFDDIKLINKVLNTETALETWSRHEKMQKGVNLSNWLEAYWNIPWNVYPEVNKYNRTNVSQLRSMGFNSFRLPVIFEQIASTSYPYTIDPNHITLKLVDSAIVWSQDMDFNLIIDNHHGINLTNDNYLSEIPRLQAIWTQIINKYGYVDPNKVFFELYNEPQNTINNTNLRVVMSDLVDTIRHLTNKKFTLIMGGNHWNSMQGLTEFIPLDDQHIIYTFHSYEPYSFTHQQLSWTSPPYFPSTAFPSNPTDSISLTNIFKTARLWSDTYKRPIMLGEYGVSTGANESYRCNYMSTINKAMQAYGIPGYYWDPFSTSDGFGFMVGSSQISCFATAMKTSSANTCAKLVTNKNDYGPGTLRDQLSCASSGDTILISSAIVGDTIKFNYLPIFSNKNITIRNQNAGMVYLMNVSNQHPLLYDNTGHQLKMEKLSLLSPNSHVLINLNGVTTLKNVDIYKNPVSNKVELKGGNLQIQGNVRIRQ